MSSDEDGVSAPAANQIEPAAHLACLWRQAKSRAVTQRAPTTADTAVGRRIRDYRLARRMPLSELSSRVGVSYPQMHRYECGLTRVAAGRLIAIASALGVSVEALTSITTEARPAARRDDVDLLLEAFNGIDRPEQRHALISLARSMASAGSHGRP
jgi:transcriptional regulator with XRE-family HTH domain